MDLVPDMSPITAVLKSAVAADQVNAILPLGLAIITHTAIGMAWYGTVYGRLFLRLAHGGEQPSSAGDDKLYTVAMASNIVAYLCFHLIVVATGSQQDVVSLAAIAIALIAFDVAANLRQPLIEMRPVGLMYMHLLYHAVSATMAVFFYTFLGAAPSAPGLIGWENLLHVSPPRLALAAAVWAGAAAVWFRGPLWDRFVELAFADSTDEERKRLLEEDDSTASNVGAASTLVAAFLIERTVAYAAPGAEGSVATTIAIAASAVLLLLGWSASLQAMHYGFEHRAIALWAHHQSYHAVAAVAAAAALVVAHRFLPTWF